MSNKYEVINDLTQEDIDKTNAQLEVSDAFYVYYDDNGNILSVTNENTNPGNYIQTKKNIVDDFLTGKKHFSNFKIKIKEAKKEIVEKEFKIEQYVDLVKVNTSNSPAECNLIINDTTIKFVLSSEFNNDNLDIPFFIVEKGNFHKVLETLVINTEELKTECERSFNYDLTSVWIITKKYFSSYRMINERS